MHFKEVPGGPLTPIDTQLAMRDANTDRNPHTNTIRSGQTSPQGYPQISIALFAGVQANLDGRYPAARHWILCDTEGFNFLPRRQHQQS